MKTTIIRLCKLRNEDFENVIDVVQVEKPGYCKIRNSSSNTYTDGLLNGI